MRSAPDIWEKIRRQGRRVYGPDLTVYGMKLTSAPTPRIVVPLKVDKRSTVRNKIKRQLREILRKTDVRDLGLVVIVKPSVVGTPFKSLNQDLNKILKNLS